MTTWLLCRAMRQCSLHLRLDLGTLCISKHENRWGRKGKENVYGCLNCTLALSSAQFRATMQLVTQSTTWPFFLQVQKKIRNGCTSHKHENSLFTFCSLILCSYLLYYHFHNNQTRPFFSLTSRTNELAPDTSASSFPFLSVLFHFCTPQLPPNTPTKDQPEAAYTLARLEVLSSSASALTHNSPLGHCQFQNEPQKNSMPLT